MKHFGSMLLAVVLATTSVSFESSSALAGEEFVISGASISNGLIAFADADSVGGGSDILAVSRGVV